ncbi:DUF4402 domain-containing protein [Altererythrobacter sp. ZODW24]|uniref:DUF4402 domain-containing protein n=1 Tax=Altererythrobacter sp. ZODW24 TaxID=2185142 RepID=UPI0013B44561|nr:DUF4402 domain-containing protein [Altererythrobacter sp. ZODW24]
MLARIALLTMCAFGAASAPAMAQTSATSETEILGQGRITKLEDLDFGQVIPGLSGGTITVAPDGTVTTGGTVIPSGGTTQPAAFRLEMPIFPIFQYVGYSSPSSSDSVVLTHTTDATETMTLTNFQTDLVDGWRIPFFSGDIDFNVGGTLAVDATQEPGTYTGQFNVVVDLP